MKHFIWRVTLTRPNQTESAVPAQNIPEKRCVGQKNLQDGAEAGGGEGGGVLTINSGNCCRNDHLGGPYGGCVAEAAVELTTHIYSSTVLGLIFKCLTLRENFHIQQVPEEGGRGRTGGGLQSHRSVTQPISGFTSLCASQDPP